MMRGLTRRGTTLSASTWGERECSCSGNEQKKASFSCLDLRVKLLRKSVRRLDTLLQNKEWVKKKVNKWENTETRKIRQKRQALVRLMTDIAPLLVTISEVCKC